MKTSNFKAIKSENAKYAKENNFDHVTNWIIRPSSEVFSIFHKNGIHVSSRRTKLTYGV
jgi:hypothetical protein